MVHRVQRELTKEEIQNIARTYHAWRGEQDTGQHWDVPGFCKSATLEEIRQHGYVHPGTICGHGGGCRTRQAL
ncbi:N-6 DNA methylase [Limisphaera ngatamarikiensis]|uniref:N-6 DNA methylase n=1 Tax=Limisphaera ngatamarikiensis TaxID=1324935 RepID=UPI003CCDEDF3